MTNPIENQGLDLLPERGIDEPIQIGTDVLFNLAEFGLSNCPHGCKVYLNSETGSMVVGHNPNYGCKITKADIENSKKNG